MATHPPPGNDDASGLKDHWRHLMQSSCTYLQARAQLLAEEARIAGRSLAKSVASLLVAAFMATVAYLLLVASLVGLLMETCDWSMAKTTSIVAAAHALITLILLLMARAFLGRSEQWFIHSRREFEHDREAAAERPPTGQTGTIDS